MKIEGFQKSRQQYRNHNQQILTGAEGLNREGPQNREGGCAGPGKEKGAFRF